jgi:hypothetical protein
MALRSEGTKLMLRSVTDEWQPVDDIFSKISGLIPPGQAIREWSRRNPDIDSSSTEWERIAVGRRSILNDRIATLKRHGYIEVCRHGSGRRFVRRLQSD